MNFVIWIGVGMLIGWGIAYLLRDIKTEVTLDVVLGTIGALMSAVFVNMLAGEALTALSWYSVLFSIVGAIMVVWFGKLWEQTM